MRRGHTYTDHFSLDTRQHELLGLDLGEGIPRKALLLGLSLYVVWTGSLLLLLGLPSKFTFTLYVLPPLVTVIYGVQRSGRIDRRWNVTNWSLAVRYLVLGHRPIICGGRRAATRSEWINRRGRWANKLDILSNSSVLGGLVERWLGGDTVPQAAGGPLHLTSRARLYGPDAVVKAHGRKALQHKGKA